MATRITTANSTNFVNEMLKSIITLMNDNKIAEFDLSGTVFGKTGWLKITTDGQKLYKVVKYDFCITPQIYELVSTGDAYSTIHRYDAIELSKIALEKIERVCSYSISHEEEDDLFRDEKKFM